MKKLITGVFAFIFTVALTGAFVQAAGTPETIPSLRSKVESWEVEDAWPRTAEALTAAPGNSELLEVASLIAFYRGEYSESLNLMKKALETDGENQSRAAFVRLIEDTLQVLSGYRRYETPHFIIHLDEKKDGILLDYLSEALEKTYRKMADRYGFVPKEKVRVELFADTKAFYLASTLSVRDIEATGAVGLTKFNKLQFLSPRALVFGYRWLDAISHEYMHYLIVKKTSNKAPIWFHEGLSKFEETRWRDGPGYLSPLYRSLLSEAQTERRLIPFEKMEPSLVRLETPEEVQLAYAQAASAIEFIIDRAGFDGLSKIMEAMARSRTPGAGESIQAVLGMEFSEFEDSWKGFLAAKGLQPIPGAAVNRYKVKEGKEEEDRMELQEIRSLVARNRSHLGDRLQERGRTGAAVLEYRRALSEAQDSVPVMKRLSAALISLGRDEEALDTLGRILYLAPDHPTPYTQLGWLSLKRKSPENAKAAFEDAVQINPFNPEVHVGLADALIMLGDPAKAAKEREIAERLKRG